MARIAGDLTLPIQQMARSSPASPIVRDRTPRPRSWQLMPPFRVGKRCPARCARTPLAPVVRSHHLAHGRTRRPSRPRGRQALGRGQSRDHLCCLFLRMVCRGSAARFHPGAELGPRNPHIETANSNLVLAAKARITGSKNFWKSNMFASAGSNWFGSRAATLAVPRLLCKASSEREEIK